MSAAIELDEDRCYDALVSRDARFDGQFIAGITSTGIYCRASCPAPVRPKRRTMAHHQRRSARQDGCEMTLRPGLRLIDPPARLEEVGEMVHRDRRLEVVVAVPRPGEQASEEVQAPERGSIWGKLAGWLRRRSAA